MDGEHEVRRYFFFDFVVPTVPTIENVFADTSRFYRLAAEHGASYDGWGWPLVNCGSPAPVRRLTTRWSRPGLRSLPANGKPVDSGLFTGVSFSLSLVLSRGLAACEAGFWPSHPALAGQAAHLDAVGPPGATSGCNK
jgi:hypothetical protein